MVVWRLLSCRSFVNSKRCDHRLAHHAQTSTARVQAVRGPALAPDLKRWFIRQVTNWAEPPAGECLVFGTRTLTRDTEGADKIEGST